MNLLLRCLLSLALLVPFLGISQTADLSKLEQDGKLMTLKGSPFTGFAMQSFASVGDEVVITNHYKDGKRVLIEVKFMMDDAVLVKGSINESLGEAEFQSSYSSGAKQCSITYKDKVDVGERISWYEDGKTRSQAFYIDGIQDGKKKEYYTNGNLKTEEYYLPDIDRRVMISYDEQGNEVQRDTTTKNPNFQNIFGSSQVDIMAVAFHKDSSIGVFYQGFKDFPIFTCSWFPDGKLQQVRVMKEKDKVTLWNSWYPNGNPHFVMKKKFLSNKMKMTAYSETGVQMGGGTLVEGEFNGKSISSYESGQKSNVTRFKHGKKHGKTETWYENGQLRARSYYLEGKLTGKHTAWSEEGIKILVANYADGELQGQWQSWHKNGQPSRKGLYDDHIQTGLWETRDTTGLLLETMLHAPDSGYSVKTVYWQNGKPRSEQNWMNNNKVGVWTQWYREGEKLSEHIYEHNIMVGYTYWHLNGKVKSKRVSADDGSSTFQAWHDNGQLSDEGQYDTEGRKTGTWKSWNPNGSKLATVIYDKDAVVSEEWH